MKTKNTAKIIAAGFVLSLFLLLAVFGARATATPTLVRDINPNAASAYPTDLTVLGDHLLFAASTGATFDTELHITDGTANGTTKLTELNINGDSEPTGLVAVNGNLLFAANDGENGFEPFVTDGTLQGTVRLADTVAGAQPDEFVAQPYSFTPVGDTVYFVAGADLGVEGGSLWQTDGTAAGTISIADVHADELIDFCGQLVFAANDQLFTTPTTAVADIAPQEFVVFRQKLYFSAENPTTGRELWMSDGTTATLVADINIGADSSNPTHLVATENALFFIADDGVNGRELWRSDGGTPAIVAQLNAGVGGADVAEMVAGNDRVWLSADANASDGTLAYDLYSSDGNSLTALTTTGINPAFLSAIGDELFFQANDGTNGVEPWSSDGTTTAMIADIHASGDSDPQAFTLHPTLNKIFFRANDVTHGRELWSIDSTAELSDVDQCTLVPTAVETAQQTATPTSTRSFIVAAITIFALITAYSLFIRQGKTA